MAAQDLFECRWGSVRLWVARALTDRSRTVVTISPAKGSDHVHQDRGGVPVTATCELLFDDSLVGATTTPRERALAFDAQVQAADPLVFVHPLHGAYLARVTDWSYAIDDDSNIVEASATFIADTEAEPIRTAGAGTSISAGSNVVSAAADNLALALSAIDIESDAPAIATAAIASWEESESVPTREVLATAADVRAQLDALIIDNALEDDLALWDAYLAAVELQAAFRGAALATTASTPAVFRLIVAAPTSPLALAARVYGGTEAEIREAQIRALNDMATVGGLIQAGTELTMPAVGSSLAA